MKKCSKCKEQKPYSFFSLDKNRKDGYCYYCKSCMRVAKSTISIERKRQYDKKYHSKMSDKYIAKTISQNTSLSKEEILSNKELINTQKQIIKIKRLCRTLKN